MSNPAVSEPRTPGFIEMGLPVLVAPIITAPLYAAVAGGWEMAGWIAGASAAAAVMVGWPLLFWLYDNGRTSIMAFAIAGAVVGATPFIATLLSGIAGQFFLNPELQYVADVLRHGASIPWYGSLAWPLFLGFAGTGVVAGAVWGIASRAIGSWGISATRNELTPLP